MSTRRTPLSRPPQPLITAECVALFELLERLERSGQSEIWESEGGAQRQYYDASVELNRRLGRSPADVHVDECSSPEPPDYWRDSPFQRRSWASAWALRKALKAAARAARPRPESRAPAPVRAQED